MCILYTSIQQHKTFPKDPTLVRLCSMIYGVLGTLCKHEDNKHTYYQNKLSSREREDSYRQYAIFKPVGSRCVASSSLFPGGEEEALAFVDGCAALETRYRQMGI